MPKRLVNVKKKANS